ncbi:MAG: peptidylprolyl isomerase [Bacteroidales bacterium]|nr:peptidylprolyl isomerase [Candidatus Cryptobacteroides caccocaballi]
MKRILLTAMVAIAAVAMLASCSPKPEKRVKVIMETTMGTVEFELFNETPLHRDNFIKLAEMHYFDSLLFHRIIQDFVVQGGDPNSKYAEPGQMLGDGEPDWRVPAEFRLEDGIFHYRGSINAAREGDEWNPERESCASQFCFMWGKVFTDEELDRMQERLDKQTNGTVKLTPEMREVYKTKGGCPHLDGQYTVFGEVTMGMDVVDAMQRVATDENDRPIEDVRILSVQIVR